MKGQGRHEDYASIGSWLKENTNINSSVAMVEIGTVGWYADRYIIDILGLTNKYNADYIADSDVVSWLSKYQPDYILRHEPRWVHEGATEYLEREGIYTSVSSFNFPGYVLLENSGKYTDAQISEIPSVIKKN
ncbi:MAG: hypothetical protein IPP22_11535 [Nitrosomonas sp.]|nr:hypothetical protein [Nitrosomonas sp.]